MSKSTNSLTADEVHKKLTSYDEFRHIEIKFEITYDGH